MKRFSLVLILFVGLGSSISFAQDGIKVIDCVMQRKLVVSWVQGQVFDPNGIPIPGAQITLNRDGLRQAQSTTDANGNFALDVPPGNYVFRAELRGFEVTTAELEVGRDIANLVRPKALKVILALSGMNCPWVTSSNKEFKEIVHKRAAQN
jgi:hypothetical protein